MLVCMCVVKPVVFSALTLFVGHEEAHLDCKNWVMRCWRGYLSGARCKWFAYSPADTTAMPSFLASLNPECFFYRATLCSRGLGSLKSVCPCVCHTRALWLIQRSYRRYFYTTWKGNPSSFLSPNSGWWVMSPSTFNGRSKWPIPLQKSLTSTDFRL